MHIRLPDKKYMDIRKRYSDRKTILPIEQKKEVDDDILMTGKYRKKHRNKKLINLSFKTFSDHKKTYHNNAHICNLVMRMPSSIFCKKVPAAMTVEASLLLPLFLFCFLNFCSLMEMMRLHGNMEFALCNVGKQVGCYGAAFSDAVDKNENRLLAEIGDFAVTGTYVKSKIVSYLGREYLEQSPLVGGSGGLHLWESNLFTEDDCYDIVVTYRVEALYPLPGLRSFRMANRYYGHLWNGYEIPGTEQNEEEVVYVTETGEVYHTDRNCTHLLLSVKQVSIEEAEQSRNHSGERYTTCELCGNFPLGEMVYITEEGTAIHHIRECSGLKRTVRRIQKSEAVFYRPCSRCGGQKE